MIEYSKKHVAQVSVTDRQMEGQSVSDKVLCFVGTTKNSNTKTWSCSSLIIDTQYVKLFLNVGTAKQSEIHPQL